MAFDAISLEPFISRSQLPFFWRFWLAFLRGAARAVARMACLLPSVERRWQARLRLSGEPELLRGGPATAPTPPSFGKLSHSAPSLSPQHRSPSNDSLLPQSALWLHAASLGEWSGAARFLTAFRQQAEREQLLFPQRFLLSAQTCSAYQQLRERHQQSWGGATLYRQLYPLDNPQLLATLWRRHNVQLAIVYESELWPAAVEAAAELQIPLWWVSARLTPTALKRWRRAPKLFSALVRGYTTIWAATSEDAERLATVTDTVPAVCGDFKRLGSRTFRIPPPLATIKPKPIPLAALSLHPEELAPLLDRLKLSNAPDRWVLQPRHLRSTAKMSRQLRRAGWQTVDWPAVPAAGQVSIVAEYGKTKELCSLSQTALVGGSLAKGIGVHNILEPLKEGCFVLTGPYWYLRRDEVQIAQRHQLWGEVNFADRHWPLNAPPFDEQFGEALREFAERFDLSLEAMVKCWSQQFQKEPTDNEDLSR